MLGFVHQRQPFLGLLTDFPHTRLVLGMRGPEIGVFLTHALNQFAVFLETLLELLEPPVFGNDAFFQGGAIFGRVGYAARIDIGPVRAQTNPRDQKPENQPGANC